jgi:hypothetical protein
MNTFTQDNINNYYNNLLFWISKNEVNNNYYKNFIIKYIGNDSEKLLNNINSNILLLTNLSKFLNNNNNYKIDKIHTYKSAFKIRTALNINEQIEFKEDNKDENLLNKFTYVPIEPVSDNMYICTDNCPNSLCK